MDAERVEKIKILWNKIHGDLVPCFYWQFHPNMYYWYNENTDSIECDCGLSMPVTFKDKELNERNLSELIRKMKSKIYRDYRKMGWDIGYPEDRKMRKGRKTKGLRDMDFNAVYDDSFDFEPRTVHPFCNVDSERIQGILEKNGKVTWGDVYAPWLENPYWLEHIRKRGYITGEEILVLKTDPNTEMKCVLDIHFGDWYWLPKD